MTTRDIIDLVLLGFLWGASFLFMRIAAPEFGALVLVEVRVVIASIVLLVFASLRGEAGELARHWKMLGVLGVHNTAMPFALLTWATLYLTAGVAAILNATAPIFAGVIAWLWLGERLTLARLAGLVIGFGGVYLLVRDKIGDTASPELLAVLAALGGAALYGVGVNFTRRYALTVPPMAAAAGSQSAAAIALLPFAVVLWPAGPVSLEAWVSAVLLALFSTALAYLIYFRLISSVGPTKAITVTYLIPISAMLLGWAVIDEPITATMLLGCAVILLGTALATGVLRFRKGVEKVSDLFS